MHYHPVYMLTRAHINCVPFFIDPSTLLLDVCALNSMFDPCIQICWLLSSLIISGGLSTRLIHKHLLPWSMDHILLPWSMDNILLIQFVPPTMKTQTKQERTPLCLSMVIGSASHCGAQGGVPLILCATHHEAHRYSVGHIVSTADRWKVHVLLSITSRCVSQALRGMIQEDAYCVYL